MYKGKSFLAIIPARAGSKRLPRKNILNLNGLPLISHTILAAKKSKYIDKVLVTSEDKEILDISKRSGANVIERPVELANDTATTTDVIEHVIKNFDNYDYIVLLQPTSPLRTEKHINEAIELLDTKKASAIASVCEMDHSPLWSNTLDDSLSMVGFIDNSAYNKRSQDLKTYYRINGAIYICSTDEFLSEKCLLIPNNIYAYKMDRKISVDIDEHIDFLMCKCLMET